MQLFLPEVPPVTRPHLLKFDKKNKKTLKIIGSISTKLDILNEVCPPIHCAYLWVCPPIILHSAYLVASDFLFKFITDF